MPNLLNLLRISKNKSRTRIFFDDFSNRVGSKVTDGNDHWFHRRIFKPSHTGAFLFSLYLFFFNLSLLVYSLMVLFLLVLQWK